jgi:hypothetical protein
MERVAGSRLTCSVDSAGSARLESIYVGDNVILLNQAVARIGDRVVETPVVRARLPGLGPRVLETGFVFEMGFYDEGSEDGGLMRALTTADSGVIRVRLEGDAGSKNFLLTDRSRHAIRDCVRLAELIRLAQ